MQTDIYTIIGYIAAVCTTISFVPQVVQTIKTKRTKDISLGMYLILLTGAILWTIYGFALSSPPIYVTNILICTLATIILYLKIKHG